MTTPGLCCDYRDHGGPPCACPEHTQDSLHPFGCACDPSRDNERAVADDEELWFSEVEESREACQRAIPRLSFGLFQRLREVSDELYLQGSAELFALSEELDEIIRFASRGMCLHCGSYDDCGCDAKADWQSTGGY